MKGWLEHIIELIAGALDKERLAQAGARVDDLKAMKTTVIDLPSFYTEPQPPGGVKESRDIAHCHPILREAWPILQSMFYARTGRELFLTCTWRSKEKQQELYQVGRRGIPGEKILTKIDGVNGRSRHNVWPSEAIDVCVDSDPGPGKHPVWDEAAYAPLFPLCVQLGLTWGGSWTGFKDYPHVEIPAGRI